MRIYQEQNLTSHSTPSIVPASNFIETGVVKLRRKSKTFYGKASDYRHSWSEYIVDDNSNHIIHNTFVVPNQNANTEKRSASVCFGRKLSFNSGLSKRSWTGSDTKLSDIKESDQLSDNNNMIQGRMYDRRNAISIQQLNQISPEKKSAEKRWLGLRRKISVTVRCHEMIREYQHLTP